MQLNRRQALAQLGKFGVAAAAAGVATNASANPFRGTAPVTVTNSSGDTIAVRVDAGGRGMPLTWWSHSGERGCLLTPGSAAVATESNYGDAPTLHVFVLCNDGSIKRRIAKRLNILSPIFGACRRWRFDGARLVEDDD